MRYDNMCSGKVLELQALGLSLTGFWVSEMRASESWGKWVQQAGYQVAGDSFVGVGLNMNK